ncbi:MAG: transcriptional repressor [bacterium]|nr:transcriptional repressor [bacterium]
MSLTPARKFKSSRQRDLILQILRSTKSHPSAAWIFEEARKHLPSISLGTVYRNLAMLKEEGRIRELSVGKGIGLFDGDLRNHDHIRCLVCGRVEDVPPSAQSFSYSQVEGAVGYRVHWHSLEYFGVCPGCETAAANE